MKKTGDIDLDDIVEPYPGWPGCIWLARLQVLEGVAGFETPQRMWAVSHGVERALGVGDRLPGVARRQPEGGPPAGWLPRFPGDMPRMASGEERALAQGRMADELIAPWRDARPPRRAEWRRRAAEEPTTVGWRWRLLAFVYLPRALHLLLGAPVDASAAEVNARLCRSVAAATRRTLEDAAERATRGGRGQIRGRGRVRGRVRGRMWQLTSKDYPMLIPPSRGVGIVAWLHTLPRRAGFGWHPQQWWWSSHREYESREPVMREGVPRVFPLRADPRRPWVDGCSGAGLLTEAELAEAWRRQCAAQARRRAEAGHRGGGGHSPELEAWREAHWGTTILGPRDAFDRLRM